MLEEPANTARWDQQYRFTQSILDQLSVLMLEDHSIFSVNDDLAWFRMLEQLSEHDYPVIKQHSTARVGALELGTQQSQFRGKLVTVRGEIRKAYRVQAQANELKSDSIMSSSLNRQEALWYHLSFIASKPPSTSQHCQTKTSTAKHST